MAARNTGRTQQWGGWRAQQLRTAILARDDTCWLCGQRGSNSLDHKLPQALFPELRWVPANLMAAHLSCNQHRGADNKSKRRPPDWLAWLGEFGISQAHPAVQANPWVQAVRGRDQAGAGRTWADPADIAPEPAAPAAIRRRPAWVIY